MRRKQSINVCNIVCNHTFQGKKVGSTPAGSTIFILKSHPPNPFHTAVLYVTLYVTFSPELALKKTQHRSIFQYEKRFLITVYEHPVAGLPGSRSGKLRLASLFQSGMPRFYPLFDVYPPRTLDNRISEAAGDYTMPLLYSQRGNIQDNPRLF